VDERKPLPENDSVATASTASTEAILQKRFSFGHPNAVLLL
jgi:hypothetical protein